MSFPAGLDELIELLISGIMIFIFVALCFNNFLPFEQMHYNPFPSAMLVPLTCYYSIYRIESQAIA
jgi:hypothetical protein